MPLPGRVPQPKHLFPEIAALYFMVRRWGLGVERFFHDDAGWYPIWTVGALTGTAGLMLSVILFVFHNPPPVVGKQVEPLVVLPAPLPTPATTAPVLPTYLQTPPRELPKPKPTLQIAMQRLRVSSPWNEQPQLQTATSRMAPRARPGNTLDAWRGFVPVSAAVFNFQPYFLQEHPAASSAVVVSPANRFDPLRPVPASRLSGLQIEKVAAEFAALGAPFSYSILVRNTSADVIPNVEVRERISALHRVSAVEPEARVEADELVWQLNHIPAGGVREIKVSLTPDEVIDITAQTSLAAVSQFGAAARVVHPVMPDPVIPEPVVPQLVTPPTLMTPPAVDEPVLPTFPLEPVAPPVPLPVEELILPELAPSEVQVEPLRPDLKLAVSPVGVLKAGQTLTLTFQVSNVGTAPAENVRINVDLSPEFQHRFGKAVVHKIKRLEPGQKHEATLRAVARKEGAGLLTAELRTPESKEEEQDIIVPVQAIEVAPPDSKPPVRTSSEDSGRDSCRVPRHEEVPSDLPTVPKLAIRFAAR